MLIMAKSKKCVYVFIMLFYFSVCLKTSEKSKIYSISKQKPEKRPLE